MLTAKMNIVGICAIQSGLDGDILISSTAVGIANLKPTVVFGENTDLLILLNHLVNKKRYRMMFFSCQTKILKLNTNMEYTLCV